MEFPDLRERYWGRQFWARGYFSTTSGNITYFSIFRSTNLPAPAGSYSVNILMILTSIDGGIAQPERVADHADRGKRHRGGRDDRRQKKAESRVENTGGDRDSRGIVDKGKEQILPDVAHRRLGQAAGPHDPLEVAFKQRHAGALDRDIGARPHGDADIGRGERRGIVDAIPIHRNDTALRAQAFDHLTLVAGQNARLDIVDAKRAGDGLGGGFIVACEHHHAHALIAQPLDRIKRRLFDWIGDRDEPGGLAVDGDEYDGGAILAQFVGLRQKVHGTYAIVLQKTRVADCEHAAFDLAENSFSHRCIETFRLRQ